LIFTPQGDPDPEKNESFGRRIEYHKKRPFYPTLSEDDFGRQKRYVYNEDGRLAAQLFAYKGAIQGREFYIYDDDGNLIEQIKDDGSSEQIDDLSTVSERRMQRLIPEYIRPDRAEPTVKENFYFDRDAGLYVAAGMHVLRLSEDAQVLSEKHYDAEHVLVSASEFEYDEDGHIIQRRCNGSNQLLEYTDLGQVASILTVETGQRVDYSYDAFGRPVVEQQTFYDGSTVTTRAQFDALGHQVAEIDAFGNRTEMEYDALGRRIRQIAPAILAESGMKRPTRVWEYDIFDRVVKTSDEDGYTTEIHYSCLGLPIQIAHPDGTTETLRYHLDGTLAEHSNAQGVTRRCRYDTWGRLVEIELLGSDGAMAAYQERSYDGFRLASVLNSSGVQQRFAYDAAGRLRFLAVDDGVHSSQREYEYDPRGQLQSARDWFDYGSKDYCEAYYGTVESGQVLSILDANGRLLQQIDPNQVAKVAGPSSYDGSTSVAHMKPVLDAFNSLGQNVLAVKLTQNDGGQQESTYDAMGRLVEQVQTDAFGQVLQHREMLYDGRGNKIVEVAHGRSGEKEVRTEWIYGPRNRLEALFEAVGDATERRTEFIYDETGRLSRRILADGTALVYFYNTVGQLERLRSTDGSVDYVYSCDEQGRVTEVEDRVLQTTTQRTFDGLGNMVYERLANSCELLTEYDRTGRPRYVQLPDGSGIRYVYEGTLLRSVVRESKEGAVLYTHRYEYDLEGRLIASELPEDVGAVLYSWDRQGRLEAVDSSYWSQHIGEEGRDADGRITAMETSDPSGTLYAEYRYDSMGQLELDGSTDESRYSYDARSNRDSIDGQRCEVDALNRLLRHGQTLLAYDARGNLISEEGPDTFRRYRYDALNRMIEVESPGKERVEYRYDAFGRRLSRLAWTWDGKARAWMGGEEERYLYYEMNEIGHCNADGTWDAFRILGFGAMGEMGAAVAIELSGSVYAPIHDQQGSVRCLIDCQTKEIVEYYRYSAFGQEEIYNGDRQRITAEEALNPWRFSSKRTDTESGLVFFGHRYFAPHLGRWTSCDPMGYFESSNLYAYTLNNPLGHKDPYGLFSFSELFESVVNLGLKAISAVVNAAQSLSGIVMDHFSMLGQAGRELESTA
ncbi:MAG: RHS repeat-associated core domain-containing protein, partial [Chlamydiia bacterium]|nr:RHS repeat-associated core domain-containing protein [Chlamydiia bacterium]